MDANLHPRDEVSYDAADPIQVRQRQLSAKRREKADRDILVNLLGSVDGRAWVWGLLSACHVYEISFDPDPYVAAFREGERNVGLRLLQSISKTTPESLILMMKERADG